MIHDYATTTLSIKAHPVSFLREKLSRLGVRPSKELQSMKDGEPVKVAGIVVVKQRPGTAKGICFITIEDESGWINGVIFPNLFDQYRKEIMQAKLILLEGKLQIEGEVIHIIVNRCHNISRMLRQLVKVEEAAPTLDFPGEDSIPAGVNRKSQPKGKGSEKAIPDARNFK